MPGPLTTAAGTSRLVFTGNPGDFAEPFEPTPVPDARNSALRKLRSLQAERHHLELRRIEVQVALRHRRRIVNRLLTEARTQLQGPVEAVRFDAARLDLAKQLAAARSIDQRLLNLKREIDVATGRVAVAIARP